jgi:hypothetical protein
MDYIVIGTDVWLKVDLGAAGNKQFGLNKAKWMAVDKSKITDNDAVPTDANPSTFANDLLGGVVTVARVDDTHLKGTVDLTQMKSFAPDQEVLTRAGDKAKAVPFTATLDTKGRLTEVKTDGTGIDPGLTITMTFTNFGSAVSITKPADAIPAPAGLYTVLNG